MTSRLAFTTVLLALHASALAHDGPRVWINTAGNRISTYEGPYPPNPNSALYRPQRVFALDMADPAFDDDGVDFQTGFPGFQRLPSGPSLASGTVFSYDITAEPLWYAPGTGGAVGRFETLGQHFGPNGTPRFVVTDGTGVSRETAAGFVGGTNAYRYNAEGDHGHLTYTLKGAAGGTAFGGPDGIYALPLQLTAPGLATSAPFYLVLGKNADPARLAEARSVLQAGLVPEPATLGVVAVAAAVGLGRRRRTR